MTHPNNAIYQASWRKRQGEYIKELEKQCRALQAKVHELQADVKRMKDSGSLFDLHRDEANAIYAVLKGAMSQSKFTNLKKLFLEKPKQKSKPAG
jgi:hypothetical protein